MRFLTLIALQRVSGTPLNRPFRMHAGSLTLCNYHHSEKFEQPTYFFAPDDEILRDWLDTDTIVNSITDLSPVDTLSDLTDITPEEEEEFEGNNSSMPHSIRRVLVRPYLRQTCHNPQPTLPYRPHLWSAMNPQADLEAYYLSPPCFQAQECPLIRDIARSTSSLQHIVHAKASHPSPLPRQYTQNQLLLL
ncbi:hypothetical protein DFJ58DRAFT_75109 [Suillus subalutaceus]|uniref:uncharacterized protein n=1 Tax=Suillus subalutaceus TaxID=48586 RepID=UPI001B8833BE|nr:uncharacterized protein DFJ58DRAFT_75109 [Suillus subalutaceus]KAG1841310.1 hypothetical protein DFJ58DRAFT_75109 [Suillus subalutaceus]